MSVRSQTKGRRHGNPPIQRKYQNYAARRELTPELIYQFMAERAESESEPHKKTIREARKSIEEKRKMRETHNHESTITWKRKAHAH